MTTTLPTWIRGSNRRNVSFICFLYRVQGAARYAAGNGTLLTIHIYNNLLYAPDRGIYEESTKTEESDRFVTLPAETIELLREYRRWYLQTVHSHGDERSAECIADGILRPKKITLKNSAKKPNNKKSRSVCIQVCFFSKLNSLKILNYY